MLQSCQPEKEAAETVTRLKEAGYNIAIITARGYHPEAYAVTQEWLRQHGIPVDRLEIVGAGKSKSAVIESIPNLTAYIDDHLAHLEGLRSLAALPDREFDLFVMDRPWNVKDNGFNRLYRLAQYADHAIGKLGQAPVSRKIRCNV